MAESETTEPSRARPAFVIVAGSGPAGQGGPARTQSRAAQVSFDRRELNLLFNLYGSKVAAGEWRDYALDMTRDKAIFSVFRRATEFPLYRIEKNLKLARKQGAYSVVTTTGLILKRGHDLARVLTVLDKGMRVVP